MSFTNSIIVQWNTTVSVPFTELGFLPMAKLQVFHSFTLHVCAVWLEHNYVRGSVGSAAR